MIRRNYITFLFAFAALSLFSCNEYLEEQPSKTSSLPVSTIEQLEALFNNYSIFYSEGNRTAIYGTDDYGLTKQLYDARPGTFPMAAIHFGLWDINYLPDDTRENFWSGEYRKIFYANMALEYVDKVAGSAEQKAIVKADAHLIRAYSYFQLANTYCLPYSEATKDEPGLTLKTGTSFEQPLERSSLAEVYELIESDLEEALKTPVPLVRNGTRRHWRSNKAAVNGFAARYFLSRNNYGEALKHANTALEEYGTLVDYNTEMRYGRTSSITIDAGTPDAQTLTLQFPYTHDNQLDFTDMVGWKEFLYFRMLSHESWWYIPSQELLSLYDMDHDLRYKYHIVEGYSYDRGMTKPSYNYPGYIFFFKDRIPSGPTTAEMMLIKAECLARQNMVGDAMATVNVLRAKRMEPGAWVNLAAGTKEEALTKILEERRREMPFVHRWFDVRRYNNNDDPNDDVIMTKTFYPYTIANVQSSEPVRTYSLPKNSRRFAVPIPRTELISSNGEIEQNTY